MLNWILPSPADFGETRPGKETFIPYVIFPLSSLLFYRVCS